MGWHEDEETGIYTRYYFYIEGIRIQFNDRGCPGATSSLYHWTSWGGRDLLCRTVDCAKELLWTPRTFKSLWNAVEIEYWADGNMRYEIITTPEEVDEIAFRAEYDGQDVAHIAVTRKLSAGTSTVWLMVQQLRQYNSFLDVDVRFCVEFGNSEECTRFIQEHITKLEERDIYNDRSDISVITDIMHALSLLSYDYWSARRNATRRGLPRSRFLDEYPRLDTQLIRHRPSNRGDNRPCFLTLHLSIKDFLGITRVDWSASTITPTSPSPSGPFRSLNNLHLKFPSHASQDHNSSHKGDLIITISAREISFTAGTDSVSLGNGFTLSSEHRKVTVNYINAIMGDAFLGTINGGNNGGRNNVNTTRITSPFGSRSSRILCPLPRRPTSLLQAQAESQGGASRWVQPRPSHPRPY